MINIENIKIFCHCLVSEQTGLSQIESRVNKKLVPTIILREILKQSLLEKLVYYIKDKGLTGVSFDISPYNNGEFDKNFKLLNFISTVIEKSPSSFSRRICIKFDTAIKLKTPDLSLLSCISLATYRDGLDRNIEFIGEFSSRAKSLGLNIEIENRPRPNYSYSVDGSNIKPDPYPRWNQQWSAHPRFIGSFFANAQEITSIMKLFSGAGLQLDFEHLCQTVQYGNIWCLEDAANGVKRFGDLTAEQKWSVLNYGLLLEDDDILFDYSQLTKAEEGHLENLGYIIRKGQPAVYDHKLTLVGEVEKLESLTISSISPGFQVYQGLIDEGQLIVGSHLPGITSSYIKSDNLRSRLSNEIAAIYELCSQLIIKKSINHILIEPQLDDGKEPIQLGKVWDNKVAEMIKQLKHYLSHPQIAKKPYYFK